MSIMSKIFLSLIILVVGAIVAGAIRDSFGSGQYFVIGAVGFSILFLWGKSSVESNNIEEKNND